FPNPNTSVEVPATVDVSAWALYAHGNYRFATDWELTAGVRFTSEEKDVVFNSVDTTGLFTNGSYEDDLSATDVSPMLGLNYFASEDTMFYAKYARGFKSGGWNVDFLRTFEQIRFGDEQVDSFEIGMKSDFWEGRGRLNITGYRSDYTDFQVFQFVPLSNGGTVLTLTNAGEVTAQGIEVDLNVAATEWLTVWATYGYTDATFDSFKDAGGQGVDYDGNSLPDAPENAWSLGMEANTLLTSQLELVASLDYAWRDEFWTNANNSAATFVEAYDIVNGRLGLRTTDGVWEAFLWGRNLADADDAIYASRAFLGINRQTYIDPRMYGLNVTYNF
ncbi:MAG: TonB-dependent receptor, partial [Halieaceae bacterium]|nr:TonB-dependent receptor [Halieaceae bacterium]